MNKAQAKTDVSTATNLHKAFVERMRQHLPAFRVYKGPRFQGYLGYGAEAIYTSVIKLPAMSDVAKKKAGLAGDTIQGMFWVSSEINPNGITGENDVARTYTIHGYYWGRIRWTQRRWEDGHYVSFYGYARDIDTVLKKFEEWTRTTLKPFQRALDTKTYHWSKNSRFYPRRLYHV